MVTISSLPLKLFSLERIIEISHISSNLTCLYFVHLTDLNVAAPAKTLILQNTNLVHTHQLNDEEKSKRAKLKLGLFISRGPSEMWSEKTCGLGMIWYIYGDDRDGSNKQHQ